MDVKDVSGSADIVALIEQMRQKSEAALRNKGKLVRNHPSADRMIGDFTLSCIISSTQLQPSGHNMAISQLPAPYAPCVLPIGDLQYMPITDMRLETHHRGRKVLLRVRTPPKRMTSIMAIAQDEKGTAVLLQLYYQPEQSMVPAEFILNEDDVFILKEPFLKCATDGQCTLRVDHLSDLVRLDETDELVPLRWRRRLSASTEGSTSIRARGNDAVNNQEWAKAYQLYSSAIQAAETTEEKQLAHLNRSWANIKLGRMEKALSDARNGTDATSLSEKGLYREARALYELGDFSQCLERLELLTTTYPGNASATQELDRTKARLREQQTGKYNFRQVYQQARRTPPVVDCATFSGPVEVRDSPGRGKGLYTKVPVSAGQLLLCEKAFAYCFADDENAKETSLLVNMTTKKAVMGGQAHLLTQLMQKLFMVEQIRALNSFGAPRTSRQAVSDIMVKAEASQKTSKADFTTCGIWLKASRINHSCVGNCKRSFIGDMQIIRAHKDLETNTELIFPYRTPDHMETYEEAQNTLESWGFTCSCELCVAKQATSRVALGRRKNLYSDLKRTMMGPPRMINIAGSKRLLGELEKTYPTTVPNVIMPELWDPYFGLGGAMLSNNKPKDAIEMICKGLQALGFKFKAVVPGDGTKLPEFRIIMWGHTNDFTPWAFLHLFLAYEKLAPQVCQNVKDDLRTAYSIVMGEKETVRDQFPQLA
ncbi:hypothetical protein ACHAQH_009120 [Verticillium albo-atrum]